GGYYCTGWLFGSEGHLITNHHCISKAEDAKLVGVEFGAECATCDDPNNDKQLACKGVKVANSTTLLLADESLDFALVKVDVTDSAALVAKYGYLQARDTPAALGESIYVMGHPAIKPKRFALLNDDGKTATITNTSTPSKCGETDTYAYNADTEGGSSGSPILGASDNKVVALHNCGGCTATGGQNTGNKMHKIVALLKEKKLLPKDAVAGGAC
ncbi:hypothetical protein As57867_003869, partial [Aphanomyces stellatus]